MPRTRSVLLDLVSWVLILDAVLTSARGIGFVPYLFAESRFALVAVVLWLGLAVFSLWVSRRFREWRSAGFRHRDLAIGAILYAYLLFAVSFGLSLESIGGLLGIGAFEITGEAPNHVFNAIALTVSGLSLALAAASIMSLPKGLV